MRYLVKELSPINVFSDQVKVDLVLIKLIKFHDARVVQLFQNIDFIEKGVDVLLTDVLFAYNFHSSVLTRGFMLNLFDLTVRALPKSLKHSVASLNFALLFEHEQGLVYFKFHGLL